jgi:hypothetical protein
MDDTTPADMLRHAAILMRERAQAATPSANPQPGGWSGFGTGNTATGSNWAAIYGGPAEDGYRVGAVLTTDEFCDACTGPSQADVQHITSWHPAVALAVADWLDHETARLTNLIPQWRNQWDNDELVIAALVDGMFRHPFAIARTYLGVEAAGDG